MQQETRRVYEIALLQAVNEHDEEQMKRFRLLIKQRLFEPLQVRNKENIRDIFTFVLLLLVR